MGKQFPGLVGIAVTHRPAKTQRVLVYDADCGFCAGAARWLVTRGGFEIESWQTIDDLHGLGLSERQVRSTAYWLEGGSVIDAGAGAIGRALLERAGLSAAAGRAILAKTIRPLAEMVYRLVAHNRHVLPGSTDACRVPDDEAEDAVGGGLRAGLNKLWSFGGPARLVIAGIVIVQVLVPLIALGRQPARFGFQMYSGIGGTRIAAVDGDGDPVKIDLEKIVAGWLRPDLSWAGRLPEAVCRRVPTAARVTVWQRSEKRTVSCDR